MKTREEKNAWQREHRKKNGNLHTKKYEKSPKGFLMRLYRNMKSRIEGVQKNKHHLYIGKALLDKDEFYTWAINQPEFWHLYAIYTQSDFNRQFAPSVDRVNSKYGYVLDNMEWVTTAENSRRGLVARWNKENN